MRYIQHNVNKIPANKIIYIPINITCALSFEDASVSKLPIPFAPE